MTSMTPTRDDADRALLAEIQKQFPIDHRPFQVLGRQVGRSEQDCLERISRLKAQGIIRQIGAIFDLQALGYQRTLVAMKVSPADVDVGAQAVASHPGISHLDKRNDPFNLWFTIAIPPSDSADQVIHILHALAHAEETVVLPTVRIYKSHPASEVTHAESSLENPSDLYDEQRRRGPKPSFTPQDLRFIRILQDDLPLLEMPYTVWAEQAEATEEELFNWLREAQRLHYLQRFAALVESRRQVATASAIIIWQVPQEHIDTVGEQMALFREVSHCYRRPVYPSWPYPLFTIIQADSPSACMAVVKRIEDRVGNFPHKSLFSTKGYKQERIKYFAAELEAWWNEFGSKK